MSIKGKCRNRSDSNAVPRSWTLLPPFHGSIVVRALKEVLQDPLFYTSSPVAAGALQAATTRLQWYQFKTQKTNQFLARFRQKLVTHLSEPFAVSSGRRPLNKEKLWKTFWAVRSSSGFTTCWIALCEKG